MLELLKLLLARWFPPIPADEKAHQSVAVDQADATVVIRRLVWSGFEPQDSISEILRQGYPDPGLLSEVDRQWLDMEIARQLAEKQREEDLWPARTDWDRLDAAFVVLRATGIIALHDAGASQADAFAEVAAEYQMRKEVGVESTGFVFYGDDDVTAALSAGSLYLTFGAFQKRAENTPAIAEQIIDALAKRGLRATWSGDIGKKMLITPFEWKKRSPVAGFGHEEPEAGDG
jgi:hypothetical protein